VSRNSPRPARIHVGPQEPGTPAWMAQGLCATSPDPDAWFPDDADRQAWAAAVAACSGCPVRGECLSWALGIGETQWGAWGGTTPRQRRRMVRGERGRAA